jgi:triphosphoribosyl-dephospho-CoA synthase
MAPSSMPCEESRPSAAPPNATSFLAARDARQAVLDREIGSGRTLVALSLGVPGPDKTPPGAAALFAWACQAVAEAFGGARLLARRDDALGPFALWAVPVEARAAKLRCVALESCRPAARLIDLDVYAGDGAPADRAALDLPPRACLCCAEPARECIRLGRHPFPALVGRARELLSERLLRLAGALVEGLGRELHLTPKPGLVDRADRGSHPDLSLARMERSIELVGAHLGVLCASLARGEPLARQVELAEQGERAMRAALGTNTHKGAAFLAGVLLAALQRTGSDEEEEVRAAVAVVAREVAFLSAPRGTHGAEARERFGVGGIMREVQRGLPALFEVGLPAFRAARARGADAEAASFATLARLMQSVEDTTALHRCGRSGLARLREDGARLEHLVAEGAHLPFLRQCNARYRRMNLTMGGVADLLGLALGWLAYRGELPSSGARMTR